MDFGKLPNVDRVDFTFAPDPEPNADVLAALSPRIGPPLIYIGPTGYNMKPWVGSWYPIGTKDRDFLHHYGAQFNTIEHNTTHYRIPDMATVERWRTEVPDDFRFCPKLPQIFSHARDLGLSSPLLEDFCIRMTEFGPAMGYCFLQLPPYFEPKNLSVLARFLDRWPRAIPLAVEVRHEQFFEPTVLAETFFQLLLDHQVATVITDVSGRRDVCHNRLTAPSVLIRFVGNALHPSDYQRIDAWAERIRQWIEQGLHSVYFFTHEPDNLLAPELAAYTAQAFLNAVPNAVLRGPKPVEPLPKQGVLF